MIHLFHGLVGDHRHYASVIADLGGQCGVCKVPDIPYLDRDFDQLLSLFDTRSYLPSVRVGNSIGSALALKTAGPTDQLILTAPPFDYSRGMVPLRKALVRDWIKGLYVQHGNIRGEAAFLDHATTQMQGLLKGPSQIKRLRHYKACAQAFWDDPLLTTHQGRITFVIGASDFTTPVDEFVAFVRKTLPLASVEVWNDCGHAVPLDAPRQLSALVRHRWMRLGRDLPRFAKSA
jgi:pimeloyl-ACP methyl ester carboxylesterase